jgi:hypothetical protein
MAEPIPFPSEHQAGAPQGPTNAPGQYVPDEEESKLIAHMNKLFEKHKKHRSKYDAKWADFYKMFRGEQWKEKRPSYRHSEVVNLVFQAIQSQVPIMTDVKPRFEYIPEDPSDLPLADIVNQVADWDWTRNNWLYTETEVLFDGHIFGTGTSRLRVDPKGDGGLGKIIYESTDPFYNFPDPNSTDCNVKSEAYFWAEPMDMCLIKRDYPTKGKYVKADIMNFEHLDRAQIKDVPYKSPTDNVIANAEGTGRESSSDKAVLFTAFLKDYETSEEEEDKIDPTTGQPGKVYVQKLKYPKGRLVQMAGNVILKDEENPIEDGFIPAQRYTNYIDPRQFWGISEVEQLESPQKMFNKLLSFALDVTMLMGNPIWVVDTTAGIDTDNLINRPGLVVEKEPGSEVRREPGVQLQPYVLEMVDRLKSWCMEESGSQEVSRGLNPTGVTAASAIDSLQQAALTRVRQKSRNLDAYLQDLGQQYLSLMFQVYTLPRIVRVTNKQDPSLNQYFKFHIENRPDDNGEQKRFAKIVPFVQNQDGAYVEGQEQLYPANGKFDLRVNTGSSMPFLKAEKERRIFHLAEMGYIDQEEVLKSLDYPNYEMVMQRMNERAAQQAQMQPPEPVK